MQNIKMKPSIQRTIFACGLVLLLVAALSALAADIWTANLTPGVTGIAANITNTTNGTQQEFLFAQRPCRIWISANGTAATTNGTCVFFFQTAPDTNTWDTANLSAVKLTISSLGSSTNTISDWFELAGTRYIRASRIENTFNGPVSNITVKIAAPRL